MDSRENRQDCGANRMLSLRVALWSPALRKSVLLSVIACLASGSAAADAPFAPHAAPPDYVVTMAWNSHGKTGQRTVTHHGNWTHVGGAGYFSGSGDEEHRNLRCGRFRFIRAWSRGTPATTTTNLATPGNDRRISVKAAPCGTYGDQTERAGYELTHLSCVTDDGIELWWKDVNGKNEVSNSAEATSVVRRPVRPETCGPRANF